jgi:hypothetical protein
MTFQEAIEKFPTPGILLKHLQLPGQEEAFINSRDFLDQIERSTTQTVVSYTVKHWVENPSGRWGTDRHRPERETGYVYEGTLVLAAKSLGIKVTPCQGTWLLGLKRREARKRCLNWRGVFQIHPKQANTPTHTPT